MHLSTVLHEKSEVCLVNVLLWQSQMTESEVERLNAEQRIPEAASRKLGERHTKTHAQGHVQDYLRDFVFS